jgi:hypothetical protein
MTAPTTIYQSSEEVVFLSDHPTDDQDMWRLYELAKKNQWNVSDLAWQTPIDWEQGLFKNQLLDIYGESFWTRLDTKNRVEMNRLYTSWMCSRLLHGEHAAAIICGQLVGMVPGAESKMFLSTQTMDEARHTEFFARFVRERAPGRVS